MIIPPTDCFYVIQASGEAAEFVAATLSMGSMADIKEAILISEDFNNDIQATIGLDNTVALMKQRLVSNDLIELTDVNPLYVPSSVEALDAMLDSEPRSESYNFIGLGGNPFIMKSTRINSGDENLIMGHVSCKPFNLPPYSEIIAAQASMKLM